MSLMMKVSIISDDEPKDYSFECIKRFWDKQKDTEYKLESIFQI